MRTLPAVALAVLFSVASTCSTPTDEPTPAPPVSAPESPANGDDGNGDVVWGIVLPPPRTSDHLLLEDYRAAAREALAALDAGVDRERILEPAGVLFRRDLVRFLAERGTSYTCAFGAGAANDVVQVARDHPDLAFCVLGDREDNPPENVLAVDVRLEELAYLAGVAAATSTLDRVRPADAVPTLGFVARRATEHTEGQRKAYADGARSVLEDVRVVSEFVGSVADEEQRDATAGIVANQYLSGAEAVYVASDTDASRAVEVAREAQRPIVGLAPALLAALDEPDPPPVLLAGRVVLAPAVDIALSRFVTGFTGGALSFGMADGVVEPVPGVAELFDEVSDAVGAVESALRSGDLVVQRR